MILRVIKKIFFFGIILLLNNCSFDKSSRIWNDENQRWRIPDLITQKTKLPPAGKLNLKIFYLHSFFFYKKIFCNYKRGWWFGLVPKFGFQFQPQATTTSRER